MTIEAHLACDFLNITCSSINIASFIPPLIAGSLVAFVCRFNYLTSRNKRRNYNNENECKCGRIK